MFRLSLTLLLTAFLLTACSDNKQDKVQTDSVKPQTTSFQQDSSKIFERLVTVLDGYQAFSGKLPLNLQDLDSGGYMFDSAYLADILPQDVALYLELASDKAATRMWLQKSGEEKVLSRTLMNPHLQQIETKDMQALKSKWQEIAKVGRLTQVHLSLSR